MSLSLLLDEHVSPAVSVQVRRQRPEVSIQSIHEWRGGTLLGKEDALLLAAAAEDGLALVTYDQKTITPLLTEMALLGRRHRGVVFVDHKTIAPSDIGSLVTAILALWERCQAWDWVARVLFLRPAEYPETTYGHEQSR
jgi:hypothetical protein